MIKKKNHVKYKLSVKKHFKKRFFFHVKKHSHIKKQTFFPSLLLTKCWKQNITWLLKKRNKSLKHFKEKFFLLGFTRGHEKFSPVKKHSHVKKQKYSLRICFSRSPPSQKHKHSVHQNKKRRRVRFRNVFGMFFNKLTFIQNTVPKEYDAAKHASKVRHEAPVLMFLRQEEDPVPSRPDPTRPALSATAGGCRGDFHSNSRGPAPLLSRSLLSQPISSKIPQYSLEKN